MKGNLFYILFLATAFLPLHGHAGSEMVGGEKTPVVADQEATCQEKLAVAQANLDEANAKLAAALEEIEKLKMTAAGQEDPAPLKQRLAEMEAELAALKAQPAPAAVAAESKCGTFWWLPWLIALILAAAGFFIGKKAGVKTA
jgi:hypothetical protein